MRFTDYHEAFKCAQQRANCLGVDQAIRAVKEYGKAGYNVTCASRSDSDYSRAEIVRPDAIPAPMLGQDATEAQRLTFGGREIRLLKEQKTFDSTRLESTSLFTPARKQRGMFGE